MGAYVAGLGFRFFGRLLRPFGLCRVLAFGFGFAVVVVVMTSSISNSTSPATVVIIAVVAAPGGPLGLQVYRTLDTTSRSLPHLIHTFLLIHVLLFSVLP